LWLLSPQPCSIFGRQCQVESLTIKPCRFSVTVRGCAGLLVCRLVSTRMLLLYSLASAQRVHGLCRDAELWPTPLYETYCPPTGHNKHLVRHHYLIIVNSLYVTYVVGNSIVRMSTNLTKHAIVAQWLHNSYVAVQGALPEGLMPVALEIEGRPRLGPECDHHGV